MSLRKIDLNLIPVLQVLLREKSVSRAAQLLGLSQPAVSAALRRIRAALGDEVLVRVGGHMELTPRAIGLIARLDSACSELEGLFVVPGFDMASAVRTFVIATPDLATFLLAPRWLDMIREAAPGVRLRFIDLDDSVQDQLAAREVDFAIMPSLFLDEASTAPVHFRSLYLDHSVALFRSGHPLGETARISEAALGAYRLLSFHPGSDWVERKRMSALLGNRTLDAIAFVPQITLLPFLLLDRDDYSIVSQKMAERLVTILPLAWRTLDFETPPIDVGLVWSHLKDADAAHCWFRDNVVAVA